MIFKATFLYKFFAKHVPSSSLKIVHAENEGKNTALLNELEEHPLLVLHPYVRSNGSLDVF